MLEFITNLIPGVGPAIYALAAAVLAVVWGFVHGGMKKREGLAQGQAKAEATALKRDLQNANKIEAAADAARASSGGLSAAETLAAAGRLRSPKDRLP